MLPDTGRAGTRWGERGEGGEGEGGSKMVCCLADWLRVRQGGRLLVECGQVRENVK